ncbi:reverse transcriptase domain-containing protein [Bacillus paranthracis]
MLGFDIKGLFDNIRHDYLIEMVKRHTNQEWVTLYVQRWLITPFQMEDGSLIERTAGTPQGGVISPVLANLFLHSHLMILW